MKRFLWLTIIIAGIASFSGTTAAETIQGKIIEINRDRNSIIMDASGTAPFPSQLSLSMDRRTDYTGVNSLQELQAGDWITVNATPGNNGKWSVQQLKLEAWQPETSAASGNPDIEKEKPWKTGREGALTAEAGTEGKYELETARRPTIEESRNPSSERTGSTVPASQDGNSGKYLMETSRSARTGPTGRQNRSKTVESGGVRVETGPIG